MSDTVIKVQNLYKEYRLGVVSHGTLRHDLASWWAKCRGKDDPNSLISSLPPNPKSLSPSSRGKGLLVKKDEEELKQHFLALNDVSFEVKQGEVLGIIGRNGAGKSTLLKVLSRITSPSSGEIMIKGKMASLLEVGTGFHPELTGRENVYMNGAILGMRKREVASKMDEIITFSGLEKFIDTPVKRYSSGMYVRLAFAVAAHLESDILILDEVLAVGDAEFQKKCLGKMDDVAKKQGRTVLFVSHNMAAVENLCNKAIMIEKGSKITEGITKNVVNEYLNSKSNSVAIDLKNIENRKGTGLIRFTDICILNERAQETESVRAGDPFCIMLNYNACKANYDLRNIRFDIGINNSKDIRVAWLSSSMLKESQIINLKKEGVIKFELQKNQLAPGNYWLTIFIGSDNDMIDWIPDVKSLNVIPSDYYGSGRMVPNNQGDILLDYKICLE